FNSPSWLYKNTPLRGGKITVLAWGKNPGVADEPVLWVNDYKTVYTSLGHWDDWKNPNFKKLAHNTIDFLLWVDRNNRGK
ncbi:MAG: ThuA domain-containing protein, partial [Puniceicoccales bacterium]|nr:ThuA domain-containing protein [Puniceicoccales bacterium]